MKLLFKILAFFVVLVVFVAVIAVFFIPEERIKAEVQKTVIEQTGRTLDYSDVSVSLFPNLGLTLENVSLSNADWAGSEAMVAIDNVDVVLALAPLLQRQVEIKRFVLNAPFIRLQKNAQGQGNWLFDGRTSPAKQSDVAQPTQASTEGSSDDISISFSDFVINDGTLVYNDAASGLQERIEDIDLVITLPDLQSSLAVKGDLMARGAELKLEAYLESLEALTKETATPARLNASIAGTTLKFEGRYTPAAETLLDGAFEISVNSLADLMRLMDPKAKADYPVESFTAAFNGQLGTDKAVYSGLKLNSDVLNLTGQGRFDLSGAKPFIGGRYQTEYLNLDHFTDSKASAAKSTDAKTDNQQRTKTNWDTTPIDFSPLKAVNADLSATVGGYQYDGMDFGGNTITLKLNNSVLDLNVSETQAFQGTVSKVVRINAAGNIPAVKIIAHMKGLQAKPFLTYFADYQKLSGTMNGNINLDATGRSINDMTKTLGGVADVVFRNGNIEGVNIVDWTKSFQRRLSSVDESYGGTKFVEMGGQFNINQGIARNSDFRLIGPLVEASGSGSVNIPNKTLNYRLVTKLLPAAQSEKSVTAGIDMPFNITGSWSNPKVRPDLQSVISDVLKDPKAAEQNLKNLKEVGKTLEDSFDGDKDQIKENIDQLKKILEGF